MFFILKLSLLLPFCYFGWYYIADSLTLLTGYLTETLINTLFTELISTIEINHTQLDIIVNVTLPKAQVPTGMLPEIVISINPLIYSYGLPVSIALILASPFQAWKTFASLILMPFLLLPIQLWGVCFELMKTLFLQYPKEFTSHIMLYPWQNDMIAVAYQLGALVLPSVAPIIFWIILYKEFVTQFVPTYEISR